MISILLVSRNKASLSELKAGLEAYGGKISWAETGTNALSMVAERAVDLLVADEFLADMTGLDLIKMVVSKRPMVSCAVVSSLSPADFHEAGEGLGILMQLPVGPGREDARQLHGHLINILNTVKNN
jgi:DNA-binding response OmpR family regulator